MLSSLCKFLNDPKGKENRKGNVREICVCYPFVFYLFILFFLLPVLVGVFWFCVKSFVCDVNAFVLRRVHFVLCVLYTLVSENENIDWV